MAATDLLLWAYVALALVTGLALVFSHWPKPAKALLVVGRYASALALYPGALKRVVEVPLGKPTRVRAYSATPNALVLTTLDVPPGRIQSLREAAAVAEIQILKQQPAALGLELLVDLPAEMSGAVFYAPVAMPAPSPSPSPR